MQGATFKTKTLNLRQVLNILIFGNKLQADPSGRAA
jgi:hypothetical protein